MEKITLEVVSKTDAITAMKAAHLVDKHAQFTPETLAENGQCFKLTTAGGEGVFVAEKRGNHLWIHGAAGVKSSGLTGVGLVVIEALAKECGAEFVAFETARAGLAKLSKKQGYKVAGMIMKKRV